MEQYIPKSALVAEIERIENAWKKHCFPNPKGSAEECLECLAVYNIKTLNFIKDFLDTLEVKEVDFEKIWKEYFKYKGDVATVNIKHLAKHFFELGLLSTITEEDCKLIWKIGDEIPQNMSEEEFFKELLKRYKAQKGK